MIYRLIYRIYRVVSGVQYWSGRRFTPAGLAVLGGILITAALGTDTTRSVAHKAFAFLLALGLVAMGWALWFRGRFAGERLLPRFGTVGAAMRYGVMIRNLDSRPQRGLMLVENFADPRPSCREFTAELKSDAARSRSFRLGKGRRKPPRPMARSKPQPIPSLPPNGTAEVRMEITPLRRGVVRLTGLSVGRSDPLGLFFAFATLPNPQSVLVLPKRYLLPLIALPGAMKYQQGGVAQASSVGESEEFVALREYRPGDPLRRIHWKSWAKTGQPVVKEFQDEFFVRHALVLDTFLDASDSELFEEAVSVAASFACTIQTQESLLDLMFVGPQAFCLTAGRGLAHMEQMLEILASVRPCRDKGFEALRQLVLDHVAAVSSCIVILVAWDEPRRELVRQLKNLDVPMVVLVITEGTGSKSVATATAAEKPERFHILEVGRIAEGLSRL